MTLAARRERRDRRARSRWAPFVAFARLLPLLLATRNRRDLRLIQRSTVHLFGTLRARLCLFSEPLLFLRHLWRQDHPPGHATLLFAAPLDSKPFWEEDPFARALSAATPVIRAELEEARAALVLHPSSATLVEAGTWSILPLWKGGRRFDEHCARAPRTAALVETLPHVGEGGDGLGQVGFSVLEPGTHLRPHRGSVNVRLRYHLGLEIPAGPELRVAGETRTWAEGRCLVFDDSFEHEVVHRGTEPRAVLLVDLWHPSLTETERRWVRAACDVLFQDA